MNAWKIATIWIKDFFKEFGEHRVPKMAAALAYYTIFSLPALLMIIIWIADIFYGQEVIEGKLFGEIAAMVGNDSAKQIEDAIWHSRMSDDANLAAAVGIITLLMGATGIFAEIQDSINRIWHIKAKPRKGKGWLRLLSNRLLSFSMIAVLGFLLLVSLMVNTAVDIIGRRLVALFSTDAVVLLYALNFVFSFLLIAVLFAVIFKILPDGKISWREVMPGVIITTILFMVGKFLLSYYIRSRGSNSPYGVAGSVVIILVWVYYSAIILFSGAVITRLWLLKKGDLIRPKKYAVWVEGVEIPPSASDSRAAP
jgi:membrane protein